MNSFLSVVKLFTKKVPFISNLYYNRLFRIERKLVNNKPIKACDRASILDFSFNKAATQYKRSLLEQVLVPHGLKPVHINDYSFVSKMPFFDTLSFDEMESYKHVFRPKGFIYSVFSDMVKNIDDLDRYKILLTTRDPRDLLVSSYYSVSKTHVEPPRQSSIHAEFIKRREETKKLTIDQYVLKDASYYLRIFENYERLLLSRKLDLHIMKYEDMIGDFEHWLDDLIRFLEVEVKPETRRQITTEHYNLKPREEDQNKHLRKGIHGDFLKKLKPETIKELNLVFERQLEMFGYNSSEL